jgi:PAS domain S-box-containing protein
MSELFGDQTRSGREEASRRSHPVVNSTLVAILVFLGYYFGAKIGFALTFQPHPVSTLWPTNSILLAALLLTPVRRWWLPLLAALPAHILVELNAGVPAPMVICWFISNCSEALIGAVCMRYLTEGIPHFDSIRHVGVFIIAAVLGPLLSSFLDAAFVTLNQFGDSAYWSVFRMRVFSNLLAALTLVPVIVSWSVSGIASIRKAPFSRYVEAAVLAVLLLAVSVVAFGARASGLETMPAMLYVPLPLLLWAAIRFGPRGSSTALLVVSVFAIWGAIHANGPFNTGSAEVSAFSVQLFLILTSMPLLFLAAVIKERERAEDIARQNEERLEMALEAAQMGTWEWHLAEGIGRWSEGSQRIFGLSATNSETTTEGFYNVLHPDDRKFVQERVRRAVTEGSAYEVEFRVPQPDGSVRWVRGKGKVLFDDAGKPARMVGLNSDITQWKQAEQALHESAERNRAILRALPDLVFLMDREGVYLDYHARDTSALLVEPEKFLGKKVRDILPPSVAEKVMDCLEQTHLSDDCQVLDYSLVIEGEERHYEARLIGIEGEKVLSVVRDVTAGRLASEALTRSEENLRQSNRQISALAGQLITAQELERRRISRQLHDDLSQKIATLSVAISRLKRSLTPSEEHLRTELDQLGRHTSDLTTDIRRLSHQLHPAVLDHLGLVSALESYVNEFQDQEEIEVRMSTRIGNEKIPLDVSVCLYRVAVEALRNIARHSGSKVAAISLEGNADFLKLEVTDSGVGFDVRAGIRGDGLGLIGAEERVKLLNGIFEIQSVPKIGTTVKAGIPLAR